MRHRAAVARLVDPADGGDGVADAALLETMADGPVGLLGPGVTGSARASSAVASPALLLAAQAGADTISWALRVGETPSVAVHQVFVSRLELRRRQEVPLVLAGIRFGVAMADELVSCISRGAYIEKAAARHQITSTRWVLTEKPWELPQDPPKAQGPPCHPQVRGPA